MKQPTAMEKPLTQAHCAKDDRSAVCIAVVEVGAQAAPPSFAELFWVHIAETPGVDLVEREQIDKVLKEHELSLSLADWTDSADTVKAGKLLRADVLLMFEAGRSLETQIPIRLRLVKTRYGMKYWDSAFLLNPGEKNHPRQADEIAQGIRLRLPAIRQSEAALFVGVGTFRSEELSPRWNWVSDQLTVAVEQHLVMSPSIVLLERHRTRSLTDERALVADLPDALRASTIFVDGSFRLERDKGGDAISVTVGGHRGGKKVFTATVKGSLKDIASLAQHVAKTLAQDLHTKLGDSMLDRKKRGPDAIGLGALLCSVWGSLARGSASRGRRCY